METMVLENKDSLIATQLNWIAKVAKKDSTRNYKDLGNGYIVGFEITPNGYLPSGWVSVTLQHPMTQYGAWKEDIRQEFFSNDGVEATKEEAIYKALVLIRKLIKKYETKKCLFKWQGNEHCLA